MEVIFVSDREVATLAGFLMLSADGVSCIHPQYPGVIFQLVQNRTDVAACGGALVAFGATFEPLTSYRKLVFGADIAHHLDRIDGIYPNIDKFPVVNDAYVKDLGENGTGYTGGNGATVEVMHDILVGFHGTRWVKGLFGDSNKAFVVGVQSRVARGFAWHMSGELVVAMQQGFAATLNANPRSTFKFTRIMAHPNAGHDWSHALGERCLMRSLGNYDSENFQHAFPAVGGEGFLSAGFRLKKFLELSKEAYVTDYPAKMQSKVSNVYDDKLSGAPEEVDLSMPITITLPVNKATGIAVRVGRSAPIRQPMGAFVRMAAGTGVGKEYADADAARMGWWADESGAYPYGDQPLRPVCARSGWGNSYMANTAVSFCSGDYSFFRAPNLALCWGPETNDVDASPEATGEVVIHSATLFQALSPMAQPKGPAVYRSLNDFVRLASETLVQPGTTQEVNSDADSPSYLVDAMKSKSKVIANIKRDDDMLNLCEPFSRELFRFINAVNAELM